MSTFTTTKDPEAVLDYKIDWSSWLETGDTIVSSTFAITPSGALTVDSETNDTTTATVWLSGGAKGRQYQVVNHITTTAGREDDRTILFTMTDK